jgi:hypothetical protein
MTGDAGMVAKLRVERAAGPGDDVDVNLLGGEGLGVILHSGAAPQIAQDDHGHSHSFLAAPRGA